MSADGIEWQGVEYTKCMTTGWKPPATIRRLSEDSHQAVRDKFHIITEGDHLVPPVTAFQDLKFPPAVLQQLASKGIQKPTPIQMQVHACFSFLHPCWRHPAIRLVVLFDCELLALGAACLLHMTPGVARTSLFRRNVSRDPACARTMPLKIASVRASSLLSIAQV